MLESAMRFLALLLALPCIAFAQDPLGTLLGAGVRARPDYDGASKQELQPIPIIRYYGRTLFARTTQGILEGGARLEPLPKLWVGAQLAFDVHAAPARPTVTQRGSAPDVSQAS